MLSKIQASTKKQKEGITHMTPWFKKRKLHMVALVTTFGLVVTVIVPTEHKGKAVQPTEVQTQLITESLLEDKTLSTNAFEGNEIQNEVMQNNREVSNKANAQALTYAKGLETTNESAKAEDEELSNIFSLSEPVQAVTFEDETTMAEEEAEVEETKTAKKADETPAPDFYTVGVRHSSVAQIQQRLMDLGFMDYAEPTELYGSITSESVKMFQRQNDLKQDGIIGPETKMMLLSEDAKRYTAKLGMSGQDITRIQTRLYEMGYIGSSNQITGTFDENTQNAVIKMQSNNGISADGKVGSVTAELIYSGEAKANLLSYGDKSEIILACQERLKELGYLTTKPDGTYGNDTVAAVKQFQSRNDLVVDGFLGPATRDTLNSSNAVANGIMFGDSGDTVKRVQELLNKLGYLSSSNVTGYFGDVTESAVKEFQRKNGLSADGNVGVKTMTKLTSSDAVKATSSNSGSSNSGNTGSNQTSNSGKTNESNNNTDNTSSEPKDTQVSSKSVATLLKNARSKVGKPYVWGSKGPNSFDCSGFVYWCLNQTGVNQSYLTSYGWRNVGKYQKISKFSDIKAGDIVVVRGHVGIAAGNGMVIDASSTSGKIVLRELGDWWKSGFIVAWRIF